MLAKKRVKTVTNDPMERQVADAVAKYHFEQQGKAPGFVRAYLVADMVVIHSTGIYTSTEESLVASDEGRKLIKSARRELRSITRKTIEAQIAEITRCEVLRSFWDLDVRAGEQVEVYMLSRSFELAPSAVTEI